MDHEKRLFLILPYNKMEKTFSVMRVGDYVFRYHYVKNTWKEPNSGHVVTLSNKEFRDIKIESVNDIIDNYEKIYNFIFDFPDYESIPDENNHTEFSEYIDKNYYGIHKNKKYVLSKDRWENSYYGTISGMGYFYEEDTRFLQYIKE